MKKLLIILFLLISLSSCKVLLGQQPQAPIPFTTIEQMEAYAGTYRLGAWTDSAKGGMFYLTDGLFTPDDINTIASGNPNRFWVRFTASLSNVANGGALLFDNIQDMTNYADTSGNYAVILGYYTPFDMGGGQFVRQTVANVNDTLRGIRIKDALGTKQWIRIVSDKGISIRETGAKGIGVPGLDYDTVAIRTAFDYVRENGGGKVYVPNPIANGERSFYACAGKPFVVPDSNLILYGDGKGFSEIRNVDPSSNVGSKGVILLPGTYNASDDNSIFQPSVEKYDISDAEEGDTFIVLDDITKAANLYIGEIVYVGCMHYFKSGVGTKSRDTYGQLVEIKAISNDTVSFKKPLLVPLITNDGNPPQLFNINNNAGTYSPMNIPNFSCKNLIIRDMTFSQAGSNEIDDTTISKQLVSIMNPGNMYNFQLLNLEVHAYQAVSGNILTYGLIKGCDFYSEGKFFDLGYSSTDITFQDINYSFEESEASDFATSLMIANDGARFVTMDNVQFGGAAFRGANFLICANCSDFTINNMTIPYPDYFYNEVAFNINGDSLSPVQRVKINDLHIITDAVGQVFRIRNTGYKPYFSDSLDNISLNNITYTGTLTGYEANTYFYFLVNSDSLPVRNDTYTNNSSTFAYRGGKASKYNGSPYYAPFVRVAGSNDPSAAPSTLVRSTGSAATTLPYTSTAIDTALDPHFLEAKHINGMLVQNTNSLAGKIYLQADTTLYMNNVYTTDSLLVYDMPTDNILGVNVPYSNTINVGRALAIIGDGVYFNGVSVLNPDVKEDSATYVGTATWDGTPPSGDSTRMVYWTIDQSGQVEAWINLNYANAGTSNTTVDMTWPAELPLPEEPLPFNSNGSTLYKGAGQLGTGTSSSNNSGAAFLIRTAPDTYQAEVKATSVNARSLWWHVTYMKRQLN